jgi:hypothetical protein
VEEPTPIVASFGPGTGNVEDPASSPKPAALGSGGNASNPSSFAALQSSAASSNGETAADVFSDPARANAHDAASFAKNGAAKNQLLPAIPTFEVFVEWMDNAHWSVEDDETLVLYLNDLKKITGLPLHKLHYACVEMPGQLQHLGDDILLRIREKDPSKLLSRLALLYHLNDLVVPLLPLMNFAEVSSSFEADLNGSASGGGTSLDDGHVSPAFAPPSVKPHHIAKIVAANRQLFFMEGKLALLHRLLDHTATSTKHSEDDFSDPPDLPKITIRNMAAVCPSSNSNSRVHLDEARVRSSIFGQVMTAFQEVEDVNLRRNFVGQKPFLEDKQERAFSIVMEGDSTDKAALSSLLVGRNGDSTDAANVMHDMSEHVLLQDSAGDTYRALFNRICSEVQSNRHGLPLFCRPIGRTQVH